MVGDEDAVVVSRSSAYLLGKSGVLYLSKLLKIKRNTLHLVPVLK